MKCPYCNNEMESGYIQCRDGVTWTPKKQLIPALSFLGKGGVHLASNAVCAYKCDECKKVIVDYSTD